MKGREGRGLCTVGVTWCKCGRTLKMMSFFIRVLPIVLDTSFGFTSNSGARFCATYSYWVSCKVQQMYKSKKIVVHKEQAVLVNSNSLKWTRKSMMKCVKCKHLYGRTNWQPLQKPHAQVNFWWLYEYCEKRRIVTSISYTHVGISI